MKFLTTKYIDLNQLDELWVSIGWKPRGAKKWKEILSKTSFVCSVWEKQKLVGFGRILEDGIMGMFYDIAVHPEHQNMGIGSSIMKILISQIKDKQYASVGLFAWEQNPKNVPFYRKFGFKSVKNGMELVKYMKRE